MRNESYAAGLVSLGVIVLIAVIAVSTMPVVRPPILSDVNDEPLIWMAQRQAASLQDPRGKKSIQLRQDIAYCCGHVDVDADVAMRWLRQLRRPEEKHGDGLEWAYYRLAERCKSRGDHKRHLSVLREFVEAYPTSPSTPAAAMQLANAYLEQKDEVNERVWLQRCVDAEAALIENDTKQDRATDPNHESFAVYHSSDAMQRLATYSGKDGDFVAAWNLWRAFTPRSDCGLGVIEELRRRSKETRNCVEGIRNAELAVKVILEAARYGDPPCVDHLVRLYREAGQLDDLERMIDEMDRRHWAPKPNAKRDTSDRQSAQFYLRSLLRAARLREAHNIDELVKMSFETENSFDGYAATCNLVDLNDESVAAIEKTLMDDPRTNSRHLIETLSNISSPKAFAALVRVAESSVECCDDEMLVSRIAYQPKQGREALKRLERHANARRAAAATKELEWRMETPDAQDVFESDERSKKNKMAAIRKPVPGSLPKTLDEAMSVRLP